MNFALTQFLIAILFVLSGAAAIYAPPQPLLSETLRDLHSSHWAVRRDAFEQLVARKNFANSPEIRDALINLLETEDIAAQHGEGAERDLYEDDDYVAYTEQLGELVQDIAVSTHDPRAWHALVYGRYNQDSRFGDWLASHREALPELTQLLSNRYDWNRGVACYVIANMLAKSKSGDPIAPSTYRHYKRLIRWHIWHDPPGFVTGFGVEGLGLTKDPEDIPFLEALAARSNDKDWKQLTLRVAQDIRNTTTVSKPSNDTNKR